MNEPFFRYRTATFEADENTAFLTFYRPDGTEETAYPFYDKPIRFEYDEEGFEHVSVSENGRYWCRYTPDFTGDAYYTVHAQNGKVSEKRKISVLPSESRGYVEIGKTNPRYLAFSDGTDFVPIGVNLAYPTEYRLSSGSEFGLSDGHGYIGMRQYERWFASCAANGVNLVRLWLGHEYFSPDTEDAAVFRTEQFSKIDAVIALAERYGLKLKLTFEQFRFFDYEKAALSDSYADNVFRKFNKRLYYGEKRCESAKMWLNDECFRTAWLEKIRILANRIGGNPTVAILELWNEMNCVGNDINDVAEWNRYMLPRVKKMFPKQLVTNSFGSLDGPYAEGHYRAFCWENADLLQIHRYLDCGAPFEDCRTDMQTVILSAPKHMPPYARAALIAETGAVNDCHSGPFRFYVNDHRGILLVDAVYTPLFCGFCGSGNIWHWNEPYLEAKNLYSLYKPLAKLFENISFQTESFRPKNLSDGDVSLLLLEGKTVTVGFLRNRRDNWKTVLRDLKEPEPIGTFSVDAKDYTELHIEPIFEKETATGTLSDGKLAFSDIRYGLLFRMK